MKWRRRTAALLAIVFAGLIGFSVSGAVDDSLDELNEEDGSFSETAPRYDINIGTAALCGSGAEWNASEGMTVYFGTYNGEPVKYRVLPESPDTQTTDEACVLLDADAVLAQIPFHGTIDAGSGQASGNPNEWAGCDLREYLAQQYEESVNGAEDAMFSEAEAQAIANTELGSTAYEEDLDTLYASFLDYASEDHLFLLSAKEAQMLYADNSARIKTGGNDFWWVRSANVSEPAYAGFVVSSGEVLIGNVDADWIGVSPALNLRSSCVLFTSALDKTTALLDGAVQISESTEWKVTLRDPEKSICITDGACAAVREDGTVLVPYTCTDSGSFSGISQISVMITDADYTADGARILYYGALQDIQNENGEGFGSQEVQTGTGTFVLPEDLPEEYHIYLLAEYVSESQYSDYASEPAEIYPEPASGAETESESETETETEQSEEFTEAGETETESFSVGETETEPAQSETQTEEPPAGETQTQTGQSEEGTEGSSSEEPETGSEQMTEPFSGGTGYAQGLHREIPTA